MDKPLIYLCGDIEKRPLFDLAAAVLARDFPGHCVHNPVDGLRASPELSGSWHALINHPKMLEAISIFLIPGWQKSRLARMEVLWRSSSGKDGWMVFTDETCGTWHWSPREKVMALYREGSEEAIGSTGGVRRGVDPRAGSEPA